MSRLLRHGVVMLLPLAGAAGVWASCAPTHPQGPVVATVHFGTSGARCARIDVQGASGEQQGPAMPKAERDPVLAIYRTPELGEQVVLVARGYPAADCSGTAQVHSPKVEVRFSTQVQRVALELGAPSEVCGDQQDNDGDGRADCADDDCAAHCDAGVPGEVCGDGRDNDHDGWVDCLDTDCAGCEGGTCNDAGVCVYSDREACGDGRDNDDDGLTDCADPECQAMACDGGYCLDAGACLPPSMEVNCTDGRDDEGDGEADCADADCVGLACDDQNACTRGEVCAATAATAACGNGAPVTCNSPPPCHGSGACVPGDGGCAYLPTPMAPCDGGFCSGTGSCLRAFAYPPSNFVPGAILHSQISGPVVLDCAARFDTTTGILTWCPNTPQPTPLKLGNVTVLAMESLAIPRGGSLSVTGERPVLLAVFGNAGIHGVVEASAEADVPGAGGNPFSCVAAGFGSDGEANGNEGGGAGGGGFGSAGAKGAEASNGADRGEGGSANGTSNLVPLRGGCAGGKGGKGMEPGGAGGGAVQVSAAGLLRVEGRISAAGGGGRGGELDGGNYHGGGGGGSGGAILLEGFRVELVGAVLTANGGGGGEGAGQVSGNEGSGGLLDAGTPAPGGELPNNRNGGNGGSGGALNARPREGSGGSNGGGGGAGGGGAGRIRINGGRCTLTAPLISPSPSGNGGGGCPN